VRARHYPVDAARALCGRALPATYGEERVRRAQAAYLFPTNREGMCATCRRKLDAYLYGRLLCGCGKPFDAHHPGAHGLDHEPWTPEAPSADAAKSAAPEEPRKGAPVVRLVTRPATEAEMADARRGADLLRRFRGEDR
jgi:hypothetical protein